jgi:hypothetical protein
MVDVPEKAVIVIKDSSDSSSSIVEQACNKLDR